MGGQHFVATPLATLSMTANNTQGWDSGATPCVYDTLALSISSVSGSISVSGAARTYRSM